MRQYDVIIVGAGPAGIFAAYELTKEKKVSVLMVEKGKDIDERLQTPGSVNMGWGGAGAWSDGKLNLSTEIGGWLSQYTSHKTLADLIEYVDQVYRDFGAPDKVYGVADDVLARLKRQAVVADLELIPTRVRHLGTENCKKVLKKIRDYFESRLDTEAETTVEEIMVEDGRAVGVKTQAGEVLRASYVIVAPGREGADWLKSEAKRLGLSLHANAVDLGVRVEVPATVMEPMTKYLYESKLVYYSKSFEDQVRTFCMCPYGQVSIENYGDLISVNGHSYAGSKTENTNFALLVSTSFTEPFDEPIGYGKYIARLANLLGDGIIVQRLGDLRRGRRSTRERIDRGTVRPTLAEATPGDLSFVLPYRYLSDILEMITALDKMASGVDSRNTLIYGVEVKFYSSRLKLRRSLESEVENLYTIGDGAGITRGLVQASASGIVASRDILHKLRKDD